MKTTSESVALIVADSADLQNQLASATSNLSAIARKIHPLVEKLAKRQIKPGSITVALHRLHHSGVFPPSILPSLSFQDSLIQTGLSELVFQRSPEFLSALHALNHHFLKKGSFITITQGIHEVTIITLTKNISTFLKDLSSFKCLVRLDNLANISFTVPPTYTHTPNIFFSMLTSLAAKQINIVEITTTSTEIAFLVSKDDAQTALRLLA